MGLFDSLPPPSANKAEATAALGKRPADDDPPATDDSASKRSRSGSAQELGSSGSGGLPEQRSGSGCTALQAAYSEDAGSRLAMEDVAVAQPEAGTEATAGCRLAYFAVFDGHGGRNVAELAAEHLHACVLEAGLAAEAQRLAAASTGGGAQQAQQEAQQAQQAQQQPSIKACKAAIVDGFRELDRRALERCAAAGWPDGCTAVAAWVLGDTALVANVGDARCVLARRQQAQQAAGEGGQQQAAAQQPEQQQQQRSADGEERPLEALRAITLTREHKAIFPQERQRIEKAGSFVSGDGRLAGRVEVSRAFGDRAFKKTGMSAVPDVQCFQITRRDAFLILACDGFWGVFSPQDAVDFAQREMALKGHGVKQTCNRLIHEAIRERRCKDNCTVLLVRLEHGGSS